GDVDLDALGQRLAEAGQLLLDVLAHGHQVAADGLADADGDGRHAVEPGQAALVFQAVLDGGHVAEVDLLVVPLDEEELPELLDAVGLAHGAEVKLDAVALDVAGGKLGVLVLDGLLDVVGREVEAGELVAIDPDADVTGLQAGELHAAYLGDGGELLLELL